MVEISLTRQEIHSLDMALSTTAGRLDATAAQAPVATFEQRIALRHDAERLRQLARRLLTEMHERGLILSRRRHDG